MILAILNDVRAACEARREEARERWEDVLTATAWARVTRNVITPEYWEAASWANRAEVLRYRMWSRAFRLQQMKGSHG